MSWVHVEVQNNMQQTIYDNKINKIIRYVFRSQSNIYDGVFFAKTVNGFCKKAPSLSFIIMQHLDGSIWFTIHYCLNRFLYMYKIFQLTEQNMYVQVTYRNPMFCTCALHKRHGQIFGAHSRIFFLNNVGNTIFFLIPYLIFEILDWVLNTPLSILRCQESGAFCLF